VICALLSSRAASADEYNRSLAVRFHRYSVPNRAAEKVFLLIDKAGYMGCILINDLDFLCSNSSLLQEVLPVFNTVYRDLDMSRTLEPIHWHTWQRSRFVAWLTIRI
jgi:hypothetical protein